MADKFPAAKSGAMREKMNVLPYDLVPFQEITDAYVRVAEYGAEKYTVRDEDGNITSSGAWNWSKGLSRVQIIGSMLRHAFAYLRGEDYDSGEGGSGLLHTDHLLWGACTLCHNIHWNLEDGRRKEPPREYKETKSSE